jgi:hypothetical protein
MSEISIAHASKALATEYTLRLRNAVARARMAQADLNGPSSAFLDENRESFMDDIRLAHKLAEGGFRFDQLCDTPEAKGVWLASESVIIYHEVVDGIVFICRTCPECAAARLCAINNHTDRKIKDGYKHTTGASLHVPVPYQAVADGCTKMQPRSCGQAMIVHSDACDDRVDIGRAR